MPASDPVGPGSSNLRVSELHLPEPEPSNSFLPPVPSPPTRSNKNIVKKNAIKQRLEQAINAGELPPFCTNCGNIETPTWRKIWVQDQEGPLPEGVEFSEKPGMITAFEVVERDENDKVVKYRVIKKSLAPKEDKAPWQEFLLCNPCGIWLCKSKVHRPRDRWDKDFERLGQERRRKGTGRTVPRPKKPRSKSDLQSNLTSEAYLPTDGLGPMEPSSPKLPEPDLPQMDAPQEESQDAVTRATSDGEMKRLKQFVQEEKENSAEEADQGSDEYDSLFRSPVIRPSTPPPVAKPNASTGPFKTPTRPTPSHRPITRSVTRSAGAAAADTQQDSPRGLGVPGSVSVRRSPRNHQGAFGETPISRTINEAFSEFSDPVHFDMSDNMDMSLLPALDMTSEMMDYYAIFSTDGMMPSSPSQSRFEFNDSARDPSQWPMDNSAPDPGDI
ncbi:hypothetical protein ACCO45_008105 [Purpureocillium lilacinum]|uniref:Uncharacterized protein n=1 Tax=Purpureocillium lilacinum TaxID=33203 RepID=A0ACC4DNW0_PURLI